MPRELSAGQVLNGKFRLERPLTQGGMGELWVAEHLTLGEPVAIKLILTDLAMQPDMSTRFKREAMAIAKLQRSTQHVVQIHDYGLDSGMPFIVMELLEGEDLDQRLQRAGRLQPREVLPLLAQLTKALHAAHLAKIIHRDLKPANIFLARKGDEEILKVLDFGLAKGGGLNVVGDKTAPGDVLGSPRYMSPEQARGTIELDGRSDLWSVGVVLFIALTGEAPFQSQKFGDLLLKICTEPTPLATAIAPELPASIDAFFLRALSKNRDDRFASARELFSAFLESLGEEAMLNSGDWMPYSRFSVPNDERSGPDEASDDTTRRSRPADDISFAETRSATAATRAIEAGEARQPDLMGGTLTQATHPIDHVPTNSRSARPWIALGLLVIAGMVALSLKFGPGSTPHATESVLAADRATQVSANVEDVTSADAVGEPPPQATTAKSVAPPRRRRPTRKAASATPIHPKPPAMPATTATPSHTEPKRGSRKKEADEVFGF